MGCKPLSTTGLVQLTSLHNRFDRENKRVETSNKVSVRVRDTISGLFGVRITYFQWQLVEEHRWRCF